MYTFLLSDVCGEMAIPPLPQSPQQQRHNFIHLERPLHESLELVVQRQSLLDNCQNFKWDFQTAEHPETMLASRRITCNPVPLWALHTIQNRQTAL